MFTSASTMKIDLNDGSISGKAIWKALVEKASLARGFVEGATDVSHLEEFSDGFIRQMTVNGQTIRERVTLTPEVQVLFQRISSPGNEGFIINTLSEMDDALALTFTFSVRIPGTADGSEEEKKAGAEMKKGYQKAMQAVIERAQAIHKAGEDKD